MFYESYNQTSELVELLPMSQWNGKQSSLLSINALLPDFTVLPQQSVKAGKRNETALHSSDSWQRHPLVISCFCPCWGSYGIQHLQYLKKLHQQIKQAGGELWVISNDAIHALNSLSIRLSFSFTFVSDSTCTIARQLGVYSDTAPLWQLVSGVSEDAYTPAVLVIDTKGRIKYSQADQYLQGDFATEAIVASVWQSRSVNFD